MSATVVDLGNSSIPIPQYVVLDASLVLELSAPPERQHRQHARAKSFLDRLQREAAAGRSLAVFPLLAYEECLFKLTQWSLRKSARAQGWDERDWHLFYKRDPAAIAPVIPVLERFLTTVLAFPMWIPEPEEIHRQDPADPTMSQRMIEMVRNFEVLPRDATILSMAERLQIGHLATLDGDWKRATGFTVFALP